MKTSRILILGLCSIFGAQANTITEQNLIETLQQHYQHNDELRRFSISFKETGSFGPQSFDFRHPTDSFRSQQTDIDLDKQHFFTRTKRGGFPGGFLFETNELQSDKLSIRYDANGVLYGKQVFKRDRKAYERELEEINDIVDFLAVKPLLDDKNAQSMLDISVADQAVIKYSSNDTVLTYTFKLNPIQLLSVADQQRKEKYTYTDYVTVNGQRFASHINITQGSRGSDYTIAGIKPIQHIDQQNLQIPQGYGPILDNTNNGLTFEKIGDNLFLISKVAGDRHVLLKVDEDGIMVFGAPRSDSVSNAVIALINDKFPDKPLKSVYVTHPHNDHIGGLTAYAKKGVTILADAYSILAIKDYGRFKDDIDTFKFRAVEHRKVVDGVKFYIPKNSHAKGQSFAYFESDQLIYEGDLLEIPFDNTIATYMSEVEKEFVEFVRKEAIPIKRIVGHHRNGNISPQVMNDYYHANL